MRFCHAGHEKSTLAIDDTSRFGIDALWQTSHLFDGVVFDQNFTFKNVSASVEYSHIGNCDASHSCLLIALLLGGYEYLKLNVFRQSRRRKYLATRCIHGVSRRWFNDLGRASWWEDGCH